MRKKNTDNSCRKNPDLFQNCNSVSNDILYIQPDKQSISDELLQKNIRERRFLHKHIAFDFLYAPDKISAFPIDIKIRLEKYFEYLLTTENQNLGIYDTDLEIFACSNFQVKYLQRGHRKNVYFELIEIGYIKEISLNSETLPSYFKEIFNKTELIENYMSNKEEPNRDRHERLERLLLNDVSNVFAIEPPVFNKSISIAGHIDFLSSSFENENFKIQINDYKPIDKIEFVKYLPQLCMYGLLLNRILNIGDSDISECVIFNKQKAIIFKPNLIKDLPKILNPHYNLVKFGQDPIDFLGNVRDYMYLDWVLLSGLESLFQPSMDRFTTIELELLNALNLDLDGDINDIALNLNNIIFSLKSNLSFITPEQSRCFDSILASTRILLDQSIKSDDLFYEFFTTFRFDPNIWENPSLISPYIKYFEALLNIYKLKIVFLRLKFKIKGYQYYILIALHTLERATNTQLTLSLINFYGLSTLKQSDITNNLKLLMKKNFVKNLGNFFSLTSRAENFISTLNLKKNFKMLITSYIFLLKNRPYAFEILEILYKHYQNVLLTDDILDKIRIMIKNTRVASLELASFNSNFKFLVDYQLIDLNGQCSPIVTDILNNFNDDYLEIDPSTIKYLEDILIAVYSMDYARYNYIFEYINSLGTTNINETNFTISIKNLMLTNFIKKSKSLYHLTDKGLQYIRSHNLDMDRNLKDFYNLKDFKLFYKYLPNIIYIISENRRITATGIQGKIPIKSKFFVISKTTLSFNLKILIEIGYIVKDFNNFYLLTDSGKNLVNKPEFKVLIKDFCIKDVKPSNEDIANLPVVDKILEIILSLEISTFMFVARFSNKFNINESKLTPLIDFLKRCNFITSNRKVYSLTEEGKEYIASKNIEKNLSIYVRGFVDLCNSKFINTQFIIPFLLFLTHHFKSITINSLEPFVSKFFQCTTNVINSTMSKLYDWDLVLIKKEEGNRAYLYSLTKKGFLLLKHRIFQNYLNNLKIISNLKDSL